MSNKDEDFCEYFKILWSAKSGWTPEQASYLNCGRNPDNEKFEISPSATNEVSKRYFWLMNYLETVGKKYRFVKDGITYWNTGSLYRPLEDKFGCDEYMRKAFQYVYITPGKGRGPDFVSRAIYREAGRIVYRVYPNALKDDVARALTELPRYFNKEGHLKILDKEPSQIEAYLKGLSISKHKQKAEDVPVFNVDVSYIVEELGFSG
jgi:hypothetical protein